MTGERILCIKNKWRENPHRGGRRMNNAEEQEKEGESFTCSGSDPADCDTCGRRGCFLSRAAVYAEQESDGPESLFSADG